MAAPATEPLSAAAAPSQERRADGVPSAAAERALACRFCSRLFGNRGAKTIHEQACLHMQARASAAQLESQTPSVTSVTCPYCGKMAGNQGAMAQHKKTCIAKKRAEGTLDGLAEAPGSIMGGQGVERNEWPTATTMVAAATAPAEPSQADPAKRALEAADAEGLELQRDYSQPSGFAGVRSWGADDGVRYAAHVTIIDHVRQKRRVRGLGNTFITAAEAALCVARAERALANGDRLPF